MIVYMNFKKRTVGKNTIANQTWKATIIVNYSKKLNLRTLDRLKYGTPNLKSYTLNIKVALSTEIKTYKRCNSGIGVKQVQAGTEHGTSLMKQA